MPKSCCVTYCTTNKATDPELKFIRLPSEITEPIRRTKWLQAIRREDKFGQLWNPTTKHVYVCSLHFVAGVQVCVQTTASMPIFFLFTLFRSQFPTDSLPMRFLSEASGRRCVELFARHLLLLTEKQEESDNPFFL